MYVCMYVYMYVYIYIYMDGGAWKAIQSMGVTKCQTWLRDYDFSSFMIYTYHIYIYMGFPAGSDGKASAYNAGDPGSIPGSGRSPGSKEARILEWVAISFEARILEWVAISFEARILEWVAISFSRGSSRPRDQIRVSCIVGKRFTIWATREAYIYIYIYNVYIS